MRPEQVQDFYPTPGTNSTCMFYTGLDPQTMEPVYVPKTAEEKFYQRTLLQYYKPENRHNVIQALIRTHTRRPAASSGNAPARKPNGTGAKPRKPVNRKNTVVNRGGVLTNDTRSSRKGRYR